MRINDVPLDVEFPHYLKSVAAGRRRPVSRHTIPDDSGSCSPRKVHGIDTHPRPQALVKDLKEALPVSRRPLSMSAHVGAWRTLYIPVIAGSKLPNDDLFSPASLK